MYILFRHASLCASDVKLECQGISSVRLDVISWLLRRKWNIGVFSTPQSSKCSPRALKRRASSAASTFSLFYTFGFRESSYTDFEGGLPLPGFPLQWDASSISGWVLVWCAALFRRVPSKSPLRKRENCCLVVAHCKSESAARILPTIE